MSMWHFFVAVVTLAHALIVLVAARQACESGEVGTGSIVLMTLSMLSMVVGGLAWVGLR